MLACLSFKVMWVEFLQNSKLNKVLLGNLCHCFKSVLSGGDGPETLLLLLFSAELFWVPVFRHFQGLLDRDLVFSVGSHSPKWLHSSEILRKRLFPGEVLHRSILMTGHLVRGGRPNPSAQSHRVFVVQCMLRSSHGGIWQMLKQQSRHIYSHSQNNCTTVGPVVVTAMNHSLKSFMFFQKFKAFLLNPTACNLGLSII